MFPAHLFHSGDECNTQGGDELSGCQADHQLPELETCAEIEEGMRAVVTGEIRNDTCTLEPQPVNECSAEKACQDDEQHGK